MGNPKLYMVSYWKAHDTITDILVSEKDKEIVRDEYKEKLYQEGKYHYGMLVTQIKQVGGYKIKLEKKEEEKEE